MDQRTFGQLVTAYTAMGTIVLDAAIVATAHHVCRRIGVEPSGNVFMADMLAGPMPSMIATQYTANRIHAHLASSRREK